MSWNTVIYELEKMATHKEDHPINSRIVDISVQGRHASKDFCFIGISNLIKI